MSQYLECCWRCMDPLRPGEPPTMETTPSGETLPVHPECVTRVDRRALDADERPMRMVGKERGG